MSAPNKLPPVDHLLPHASGSGSLAPGAQEAGRHVHFAAPLELPPSSKVNPQASLTLRRATTGG